MCVGYLINHAADVVASPSSFMRNIDCPGHLAAERQTAQDRRSKNTDAVYKAERPYVNRNQTLTSIHAEFCQWLSYPVSRRVSQSVTLSVSQSVLPASQSQSQSVSHRCQAQAADRQAVYVTKRTQMQPFENTQPYTLNK